jgi:hypothetical protein
MIRGIPGTFSGDIILIYCFMVTSSGTVRFIENVEKITGPRVKARKPGPEPKIVN